MKEYKIEEKEIFSMLTSKQISEINDAAEVKYFNEGDIVFEQKAKAKNLFILLEGEVALRLPSRKDMSIETFSLTIETIRCCGVVFGPNLLFGIKRYISRARVTKPSKIMVLDAEKFLDIIRQNKSEFPIMSYLAKVYFQRYINAIKEFEQCAESRKKVHN
jgi:signal-transduction protein with cAMP-binding, CBS, and nucleotidyltransferase domain